MQPNARRRRLVPLYSRHGNQVKFYQAAGMRNNPTPAEVRMWNILSKEVVPNFPKHIFLRQYVLFGYILDFYCPTLQLCIEIDGDIHEYRKEDDQKRDNNLRRNGIEIFRFHNADVFNNPMKLADSVCQYIEVKTMPRNKKICSYSH